MDFFNAAADWAEKNAVVCVMERDEHEGWYARVQMRDSVGPFSAMVNLMPRNQRVKVDGKRHKRLETFEEYSERVAKAFAAAVVAARKRRIGIRAPALVA